MLGWTNELMSRQLGNSSQHELAYQIFPTSCALRCTRYIADSSSCFLKPGKKSRRLLIPNLIVPVTLLGVGASILPVKHEMYRDLRR